MRARIKAQMRRIPMIYALALVAVKALDIRRGRWTEPELRLIPHVVRPGESAVDVGANYGLWSYHLARAVGRRGSVVAFEPVPQTFRALRRVYARIMKEEFGAKDPKSTMLLDGCGFVSVTAAVCVWKRSRIDSGLFAPNSSFMIRA